jgi:hypothetical protein
MGNPCGRAQVALVVGRVHPQVGAQMRRELTSGKRSGQMGEVQTQRVLTDGKGHGHVGPDADSLHESDNGRDHRD